MSYEGAKTDFERWGMRVRVGGHVFCDDAGFEPCEPWCLGGPGVRQTITEALNTGAWRRVAQVDRLIHIQRVAQ